LEDKEMKKSAPINYVAVLPRELRPLQAINSIFQIPDSMLIKLAEPERLEQKAKRFPKRKMR